MAALQDNTIIGNNTSPARNTRSRCSSRSALALLAAAQVRAENWTPNNIKHEESPLKQIFEMDNGVLHEKEVLNYGQLIQHPILGDDWKLSSSNEFGQLAQGIGGRVTGTNTVFLVSKSEVPPEQFKDVPYRNVSVWYAQKRRRKTGRG